jgi:multidrug efflux pump subunit AcrA (membrane-fusion protein)
MMPQPAALYLTRFDIDAVSAAPTLDLASGKDLSPLWKHQQPEPQEDIEARIAAAREEAYAEGAEAARAEAAAAIDEMRGALEAQLAEERQKWVAEEGELLKAQLTNGLTQLQDVLADSVGHILRPFVVESLRKQMIEELVGHVASMAANPDKIAIKICGPADLLVELQSRLGEGIFAIDYEVRDGIDVQVSAAQTMIETRLKVWIDLINANTE